ncbi:PH-like domain-containing protein [Sphingomonas sp. LR61]|uniref:PH-like domain-containing protein n=1 Tax=Sphingomonas sp. LR61 TaxID=3050234 RepID=UPI003FA783F0
MARTWRTRTRKQAESVPSVPVPTTIGPEVGSWDGFSVATTRADQPLERITAGGLGFRGRGGVRVHATGVVLRLAGADDRWIARAAVRGADRSTWAIDRVVEPGDWSVCDGRRPAPQVRRTSTRTSGSRRATQPRCSPCRD